MEAIVPNGNTSLIVDDKDRLYCRNNDEVLNRVSTAAENVMNNDNSNAHDAGARAERVGFAGISATERNGAESRGNSHLNSMEARILAREEGHESRDQIRRSEDAIERFGLKNLEATKDSLKDILISTKDDLKNVLISQKDDLKDLLISTKNDFKDVLLKNCQIEKDMLLQFKDAQLIAMQNKADLQRQIAECCCENKALIIEKANDTDSLIRKLDEDRVRDQLRKAQGELEALRLRASLLPPLTPAVTL